MTDRWILDTKEAEVLSSVSLVTVDFNDGDEDDNGGVLLLWSRLRWLWKESEVR